jgi:hypothetical protein
MSRAGSEFCPQLHVDGVMKNHRIFRNDLRYNATTRDGLSTDGAVFLSEFSKFPLMPSESNPACDRMEQTTTVDG